MLLCCAELTAADADCLRNSPKYSMLHHVSAKTHRYSKKETRKVLGVTIGTCAPIVTIVRCGARQGPSNRSKK